MRLDKFLTQNNIGSRSEVKVLLKKGLVMVNGETEKKPDVSIDETKDNVCYKGKLIANEPFVYYLLNKPAGTVSAAKDNLFPNVVDLLKAEGRKDLFPIGRLDKDTEGLLLLTNDGVLAHHLLSPKKHIPKTYFAKILGAVTPVEIKAFATGLEIGEKKETLPAKLVVLSKADLEKKGSISEVEVTITEGKFHQVKRMFHAVGMDVLYLKRIAMGNVVLDNSLPVGSYRKLKKTDII